jgi:predicted glycogen debranching enzyme
MQIILQPDVLNDFTEASRREWLVTNGMGGYASGSLSGANTRRYHGLLVAALTPPTGRFVLLSKVEEAVTVGGKTLELSANQYPGAVHPQGYELLERFEQYPAPTFFYRPAEGVSFEKRIWLDHGANTTYVRYTLTEAHSPAELRLTPLVCWKDYHSEMRAWGGFPAEIELHPGRLRVRAVVDSPDLCLSLPGAAWESDGYWHYDVQHEIEKERGLEFEEDLYCPGHFHITLAPGQSITLTATIEDTPSDPEQSWQGLLSRQKKLLDAASTNAVFGQALTLAADAFVVDRRTSDRLQRSTIIAGYPWFTDWGRDTMIALPGLCLTTGRHDVAKEILLSYAPWVSQGMIPNRFPDHGEEPEYNTVDATLWYIRAIKQYVEQAADGTALLLELWPTLTDIVTWHLRGTRYGIGVDEEDGLLCAGEPGVQLTWMDARVGDWVVTARIGKPVEISALWIDALESMASFAERVGADHKPYSRLAAKASRSFRESFVRPDGLGLYDVLAQDGPDHSIRPNQIFAVSLSNTLIDKAAQKRVVDVVKRELLTPRGLRTLSPNDPAYCGRYEGGPVERDGAYHQGTVWPWLLGPFAEAHYRVCGDKSRARSFLEPLQEHLAEAGVGSLSEVFDGDPPHRPNGCIAQAWSVAETFRVWSLLRGQDSD